MHLTSSIWCDKYIKEEAKSIVERV